MKMIFILGKRIPIFFLLEEKVGTICIGYSDQEKNTT